MLTTTLGHQVRTDEPYSPSGECVVKLQLAVRHSTWSIRCADEPPSRRRM